MTLIAWYRSTHPKNEIFNWKSIAKIAQALAVVFPEPKAMITCLNSDRNSKDSSAGLNSVLFPLN